MEFLVIVVNGEGVDRAHIQRAVKLSDSLFLTGVVATSSADVRSKLCDEGVAVVAMAEGEELSLRGAVMALDSAEQIFGMHFDGVVMVWQNPEQLSAANLLALRDCFDVANTQIAALFGATNGDEEAPSGIVAFKSGTLRRLAELCPHERAWRMESWTRHGFVVKKAGSLTM